MSFITQLAQQAGTAATQGLPGAIFGLAMGGINDRRQVSQQHRLTDIQIEAEKNLTDYNMQKQLQMWKDTSYGAQMEQLQKAGLNPGLIYGMGGGGGQTTGNTSANATAATAQQNPGEVQQMMGMGLQAGMMQAQIDLMKAEARKANTEADYTAGAKTGETTAQIGNINVDTELKKIQKQVQAATIEEAIRIVTQSAANMDNIVEQGNVGSQVARGTQQNQIQTAKHINQKY